MLQKLLPILVLSFLLGACSLSLSPEKAATTTIAPDQVIQAPPSQAEAINSMSPDPVDDPTITDQELLDELDALDELDLNSDLSELDQQLD